MDFDPAKVQLLVAVHTYGTLTPPFVQSLGRLTAHLPIWGIRHALAVIEDCYVDRGRDKAAAAMLEGTFTHLLFIDGDIEFDPPDVLKLLKAGKRVVAGVYKRKDQAGRYEASFLDPDPRKSAWDQKAKALEVEAAATGFMLIERPVFEALRDALPEIAYRYTWPDGRDVVMHAFFEHRIVGDRRLSGDVSFCRRWRDIGGDVWVVPDIRLSHWGKSAWDGRLQDELDALPGWKEKAEGAAPS